MEGRQSFETIDFAVLKAYGAGDEAFVREVLAIFRGSALEWASQLAGGAVVWRAIVHTLKGASRSIGARRLGDLCEQAEGEGEAALPKVVAELEAVLAEIDAYLGA